MKLDDDNLPKNTRDQAHMIAFYSIALLLSGDKNRSTFWFNPVKNILFKSILFPIKSKSYYWHNSGGITRTIGRMLRKVGITIHKGTNPDQTMPCNIYAALSGDMRFIIKFTAGMILRLGFYPNGEHILLKIHHMSPVLRYFKLFPLYWLTDIFFYVSARLDMKKPIRKSTTNKIRAYIYLIQASRQPTFWTKRVLYHYKKAAFSDEIFSSNSYFKAAFKRYYGDHEITNTMPFDII